MVSMLERPKSEHIYDSNITYKYTMINVQRKKLRSEEIQILRRVGVTYANQC